jgi:hypothetical protein
MSEFQLNIALYAFHSGVMLLVPLALIFVIPLVQLVLCDRVSFSDELRCVWGSLQLSLSVHCLFHLSSVPSPKEGHVVRLKLIEQSLPNAWESVWVNSNCAWIDHADIFQHLMIQKGAIVNAHGGTFFFYV